jgi:PHP family Zn ribbon phosphoesterase
MVMYGFNPPFPVIFWGDLKKKLTKKIASEFCLFNIKNCHFNEIKKTLRKNKQRSLFPFEKKCSLT